MQAPGRHAYPRPGVSSSRYRWSRPTSDDDGATFPGPRCRSRIAVRAHRQMVGAQGAAMIDLRRALVPGRTLERADRHVNRAAQLMRFFTEQGETMSKLKGKAGQLRV